MLATRFKKYYHNVMANVTIKNNKINSEIHRLRDEVALLRSLIIGVLGEDNEGRYRPGFVRTILKVAKERPRFAFKNPEAFLSQLKKV